MSGRFSDDLIRKASKGIESILALSERIKAFDAEKSDERSFILLINKELIEAINSDDSGFIAVAISDAVSMISGNLKLLISKITEENERARNDPNSIKQGQGQTDIRDRKENGTRPDAREEEPQKDCDRR